VARDGQPAALVDMRGEEGLMKDWITNVITRELKALRREIETYPSEQDLWEVRPGITNPGGNLALHLAGNIQYFLGNVLGKSGYARNRDAEFGSRDVPRSELLHEIDNAIAAVQTGMSKISEADLALRGPGDFFGTRQSGLPEFRVADLLRDAAALEAARRDAVALVREDPQLRAPEHRALRGALQQCWRGKIDLAGVG